MSSTAMSVGSVTTGGSTTYPWPVTWNDWYPSYPTYVYPTNTYTLPAQDYANEVEVERGDHDAVLRFYRTKGTSRTLVKEITVPLGVLDWLTTRDDEGASS